MRPASAASAASAKPPCTGRVKPANTSAAATSRPRSGSRRSRRASRSRAEGRRCRRTRSRRARRRRHADRERRRPSAAGSAATRAPPRTARHLAGPSGGSVRFHRFTPSADPARAGRRRPRAEAARRRAIAAPASNAPASAISTTSTSGGRSVPKPAESKGFADWPGLIALPPILIEPPAPVALAISAARCRWAAPRSRRGRPPRWGAWRGACSRRRELRAADHGAAVGVLVEVGGQLVEAPSSSPCE